jgi:hypothetical protein
MDPDPKQAWEKAQDLIADKQTEAKGLEMWLN